MNWQIWSEEGQIRWRSTWAQVNTPKFESTWRERPGEWTFKSQPLGTKGPRSTTIDLRPYWYTATGTFASKNPEVIGSRYVGASIPDWYLLAASLPLPAIWIYRLRRRRLRRGQPLCLSCGYNLTGNTSGICPECGTPARQQSEPATNPT